MAPENLYEKIRETRQFLVERGFENVRVGIILGSGMDGILTHVEEINALPYSEVPHCLRTGVIGHSGQLILGVMGGVRVVIFSGRVHYYEGYEMWQVGYAMRILASLGVEYAVTTCAAGGLNEDYAAGDIITIRDHISMMPENPLRGVNDERLGIRFPDMSNAYDKSLRSKFTKILSGAGIAPKEGVYLGLAGPSLETIAEYAFFHHAGADLVGMSIVPEVITAAHAKLPVLAVAVVSNLCYPPAIVTETTAEEVVRVVRSTGVQLAELLAQTLGER